MKKGFVYCSVGGCRLVTANYREAFHGVLVPPANYDRRGRAYCPIHRLSHEMRGFHTGGGIRSCPLFPREWRRFLFTEREMDRQEIKAVDVVDGAFSQETFERQRDLIRRDDPDGKRYEEFMEVYSE